MDHRIVTVPPAHGRASQSPAAADPAALSKLGSARLEGDPHPVLHQVQSRLGWLHYASLDVCGGGNGAEPQRAVAQCCVRSVQAGFSPSRGPGCRQLPLSLQNSPGCTMFVGGIFGAGAVFWNL